MKVGITNILKVTYHLAYQKPTKTKRGYDKVVSAFLRCPEPF